jgi:hypothetical protein
MSSSLSPLLPARCCRAASYHVWDLSACRRFQSAASLALVWLLGEFPSDASGGTSDQSIPPSASWSAGGSPAVMSGHHRPRTFVKARVVISVVQNNSYEIGRPGQFLASACRRGSFGRRSM